MNNGIEESYCSFEVSKLLLDKGFDCLCRYYFFGDKRLPTYARASMYDNGRLMQPTHTLAIKWIMTNFDISINIHPHIKLDGLNIIIGDKFQANISRLNHTSTFGKRTKNDIPNGDYRRPRNYFDATEAALLYTLNNLI